MAILNFGLACRIKKVATKMFFFFFLFFSFYKNIVIELINLVQSRPQRPKKTSDATLFCTGLCGQLQLLPLGQILINLYISILASQICVWPQDAVRASAHFMSAWCWASQNIVFLCNTMQDLSLFLFLQGPRKLLRLETKPGIYQM